MKATFKIKMGKDYATKDAMNAIKYKLIQRMFAVIKRGTPFVLFKTYKS